MHINDLDTPAVLISVDVVERNLQRLGQYCRQYGLNLRPHTQTHKIPEFAHRQLRHGAVGVTEIRPGTYIFNDKNTVCGDAAAWNDCAVTVLTSVVSKSVQGRAIIDAGSKTLSSDSLLTGSCSGYGEILDYPQSAIAELSEEHGHLAWVTVQESPKLATGCGSSPTTSA